jgi:hypothetical protein
MSKSRAFSIYLLKSNFDAENALKDEHGLEANEGAEHLPAGAKLFVLDNDPYPPWWKSSIPCHRMNFSIELLRLEA